MISKSSNIHQFPTIRDSNGLNGIGSNRAIIPKNYVLINLIYSLSKHNVTGKNKHGHFAVALLRIERIISEFLNSSAGIASTLIGERGKGKGRGNWDGDG